MGEVVELPAGKARRSHVKRLKSQDKAEKRKAVSKTFMQRLSAFGAGSKRLALASVRSISCLAIGAVATTLQAFRRPFRILFTFGAIAMAGSVVIQSMNDWKDPVIAVWSIGGVAFFLGSAALYDSLIGSLFNIVQKIKQAS